ncbi:hypothetical protein HMP09_1472 [Sphingomonas sp. HMP9]|uniref:hypothetical protein n=1 Tax=Sphingomonas sp. HMP9 TaxID=1517554 RepID=UPI00159699A7|nr:hypothetical protein [Sphingomonas sp. HMP9]BCA62238.1 hypothetical protein HMP09_1472 [Sphingomonas sp. HMP9]
MTILAAIMLAQAPSLFSGADPIEIINICTANSDLDGKVRAETLRSESRRRGWSKSEDDMLIKICKSSEDGAREARDYIKKRENRKRIGRRRAGVTICGPTLSTSLWSWV